MEGKFDENKPPVYEHIRPFRFVKPYEHQFRTYCKKRWIKRKLIDILTEEFKAYNKSYYLRTIENGKLTINDKLTKSDYIMRDNDLLVHKTLRVELPILDLDVKIINEDEDFLCVNKPPGVTIHTGGGYNYNTLLALMFFEYKKSNLFVLHRLDKCTSGVILFAKNK
jgi:23S rRNA-/tRNA-specific pseudouridylate synthase